MIERKFTIRKKIKAVKKNVFERKSKYLSKYLVYSIILFTVFSSVTVFAQDAGLLKEVEAIKADDNYLYGEAKGETLEEAYDYALRFLVSQISLVVKSEFNVLTEHIMDKDGATTNEKVESVVNTYSQATLNNLQQIVLSQEPNAHVFRYIRKDEIAKIFESRKEKVLSYIELAEKAEKKLKISDALQYYYWGLMLASSLPYGENMKYYDKTSGKDFLMSIWLKDKINEILSDIEIELQSAQKKETYFIQNLKITYHKQPVSNFTFSYFDGRNWIDYNCAKDGRAAIDLRTLNDNFNVKAEYQFKSEAKKMDFELNSVMDAIGVLPFPKSKIEVPKQEEAVEVAEVKQGEVLINKVEDILPCADNNKSTQENSFEVKETEPYINIMRQIENSIKTRDFASVMPLFTTEGYLMFNKLVNYGNATIINQPEYTMIRYDSVVMCKSIPMQFKFKNNKTFVEDIVFRFNPESKIESVAFTLSQQAEDDILKKDKWTEKSRLTLINFLENYQTAYALKRADYIESIFSEDALIIVGTVLEPAKDLKDSFVMKQKNAVKYTSYTKETYIKHLKTSFASKEYINLHFSDNEILKAGSREIYGVQIQQQYLSNNYGDKGYLFLLVDLRQDTPVIHIRTWQPDKDPDFGYFDIDSFDF